MICEKCGQDAEVLKKLGLDGWSEVPNEEITAELKVTTTQDHKPYVVLCVNGLQIGSFNARGFNPYNDRTNQFRVVFEASEGFLSTYFRVYRRPCLFG